MTDQQPTPPQHTITEGCRCGASISVTTTALRSARRDVTTWRDRHVGCLLSNGSTGFRPAGSHPRA